jgi:hypothetical protein
MKGITKMATNRDTRAAALRYQAHVNYSQHVHNHEPVHFSGKSENVNLEPSPPNGGHVHDVDAVEAMKQIKGAVMRDAVFLFAQTCWNVEEGALVNGCKSIGISKVRQLITRIKERNDVSNKGGYLLRSMQYQAAGAGVEWGKFRRITRK